MTVLSFERILRVFRARSPFRPFVIEFYSGDRVEIRHPEALARTGDVFLFRGPNREQRLFEPVSVVQFIDMSPSQAPEAS